MSEARNTTLNLSPQADTAKGFRLERMFTEEGLHPFDQVTWNKRNAKVGEFEQEGVEFPDSWSDNAVNITTSKYFRGKLNSPEREWSLKQMINRVVGNVRKWGEEFGYFEDEDQADVFESELAHLLLHQRGSFNSPVWFNVGVRVKPQCSACFILAVDDDMVSILDWIRTEGLIFKGGSGSGINLSPLRGSAESLSQGGRSSGPIAFMRGADSVAGMIKSGGTTRRAAKMVVLDIDHPDIHTFIRCKADEEKKVRALIEAGYDMADLNNAGWDSIQFQNANNSVRISDEFMEAVLADGEWSTRSRVSGEVAATYKAKDILSEIAQAAWESGDPGVQYDTTINRWHTCPNSGRINASNPCSEYMHLDNSACNLASINLLSFLREDGTFAIDEFKQAVRVFILAQEIIVEGSGYPTEKIAKNARDFRELGLGFANLGALLMTKGLPYDSDEARAWAGAISSLMAGEAYRYSAEIAGRVGPFAGFAVNREPMLKVVGMHKEASLAVDDSLISQERLVSEMKKVWQEALELGEKNGFRNSQVTVIAPTGTIAFMMDCDTTGIEPDFSLVKMKRLVGGGWMKIVNQAVPRALRKLGYGEAETKEIVDWITEHGSPEGAPHIKEEHQAIFDTAVRPKEGTRSIPWRGHVKMVAAVQPFISGAISKTFNMPHDTTKEEIEEAYLMAWELGIKALAVYRDGSKASQPLSSSDASDKSGETTAVATAALKTQEPETVRAQRERLPDTRPSETHRFVMAGHKGYLTYSTYDDGRLAEIFVRVAKQGSTLSGLLDAFALSVSIGLQHGVPLKVLAEKYIRTRFEPAGYTENPQIMLSTSIVDYIFRYLGLRFLSEDDLLDLGLVSLDDSGMQDDVVDMSGEEEPVSAVVPPVEDGKEVVMETKISDRGVVDAGTVCRHCGGMMVQSGTCYTCLDCGEASGGC